MTQKLDEINITEILSLLPHRYPFILVDRILDFKADQSIQVLKNVTINELFFTGHFPGNPVMPGVLVIEAMAQAMALLCFKTLDDTGVPRTGNELFYFAGIDKARFKQPIIPGDQLIIDVHFGKKKRDIVKAQGTVRVRDEIVCTADIMAAYKRTIL